MTVEPNAPEAGQIGVDIEYRGYDDSLHRAPQATVDLIRKTIGPEDGDAPGPLVVTQGQAVRPESAWHVATEDGRSFEGTGDLPGLPLGYHELDVEGSTSRQLIVVPTACPPLTGLREWGFAVQLYALRSRESWGIGDFRDLAGFADIARGENATTVLVNPLHASLPGIPQEPSPYYPSSREFRNPIYLRIEDVPGAENCAAELEELDRRGRALNDDGLIDRNAIWDLKQRALETIWARITPPAEFERYIAEKGEPLEKYATFCAISEVRLRPWSDWPPELHDPKRSEVSEFARAHESRVRFHQWQQWLLDKQLEAPSARVKLVQDLPIGVDPAGADAWLWQDCLALDMRVGAPPDEFNTRGQDWGLPPFSPRKLRAANYAPFIRTLRAGMVHGGGLRIDHVMGLFRLFWIPEGQSPKDGTYVRYPWRDLLGIVALESGRAGAQVIGEDLGTVLPWAQRELEAREIGGYDLAWFNPGPPSGFRQKAMAAVTTHDLPTTVGLLSQGIPDLAQQQRLGTFPNVEGTKEMAQRVLSFIGLTEDSPPEEIVIALHRLLATAPSAFVVATLEDCLGVEQRPNYPGTTGETYPNWSVPLPVPLEDIPTRGIFTRTAAALREGRGVSQSLGQGVS